MKSTHALCLAGCIATAIVPTDSRAQQRHADAGSDAAAPAHAATTTASSAPAPDDLLRHVLQVDDRFESALDTGCTYEATIRGSVRPVQDNGDANATTQRLRPDLRVAATVRCPNSTESHIQERRVYSTGVTREELERLVELNATVHRMQNSGRCLYVPTVAFHVTGFAAADLGYLCPRTTSAIHGGAVSAASGRPAAH